MRQVAPESKIQLVIFNLSPRSLLGLSALDDIHAMDTYIFCEPLSYVLFSDILSIFGDMYAKVLGFLVFQ